MHNDDTPRRLIVRDIDTRQHRSPVPVAENIVSRAEIDRGVHASLLDLIDELRLQREQR